MLNSPILSIFQHFHAIPLRSPLSPSGSSPRWGAKNVLPLNLIALPVGRATFDCFRKRFSRFYRFNGFNGFSGFNRFNRFNGFNGFNRFNGLNGFNGVNGLNGVNGVNGGAAPKNQKRREVYMGRCPNVVFKSAVTSIAFSK